MKITYQERFSEGVQLLVGELPPEQLVIDWLEFKNDDFQSWVVNCLGDAWPQGIAVLDAAQILADHPKEGPLGHIDYTRPSALELEEKANRADLLQFKLDIMESLTPDLEIVQKALAKTGGSLVILPDGGCSVCVGSAWQFEGASEELLTWAKQTIGVE